MPAAYHAAVVAANPAADKVEPFAAIESTIAP
jgi:hypothetical protein